MHNLISHNQLASWHGIREEKYRERLNEAINDYFECLSDTNDTQFCRRLLKD